MKRNIVVGLDLGSSKIAAAVGEINPDRSVSVLAFSKTDSAGLRRGSIIDIDATSRAIDEVLEEVERVSGIHITSVRTNFSGTSVSSVANRATIAVGHPHREISSEDVERAIQAARMISVPPDRSVVHIIPRQYVVDGNEGVIDPTGMVGVRLEVEVVIVTAATSGLQNMVKTVNRTGTKVKEIVLSSMLSAETTLQAAEKDMGVVLVDIGGGTTDISVFEQGSILFASVLPIGGDYITRDLAVGLRTTMEEARRIKENEGFASVSLGRDDVMIEVSSIYGKDSRRISEKMVASIIQPRVEEIIELIDNELRRSGYKGMLPGGVVLTGGTSLLRGIAQVSEEYLNTPVRIGYPENMGTVPSGCYSPEYSTVLGTILYGARAFDLVKEMEQEFFINKLLGRLSGWFRDLFR